MIALLIFQSFMQLPIGVREVKATSCQVIPVYLSPGLTTQLIFEQAPVLSLHADDQHFKVHTNEAAPRSIAIIPNVDGGIIAQMFPQAPGMPPTIPSAKELVRKLDQNLRTNLFVFFKKSNQLMFELRFVEKSKADYIIHIKQSFSQECVL